MTTAEEIRGVLNDSLRSVIRVVAMNDGGMRALTSFHYNDGDHPVIAVVQDKVGNWSLSDMGNTLMRQSGSISEAEWDDDQSQVRRVLAKAGATESEGVIARSLPPCEGADQPLLSSAYANIVFDFAYALLRIDEIGDARGEYAVKTNSELCLIGKVNEDGSGLMASVQFQGFPSYTGFILSRCYRDEKTVDELLSLGNLDTLGVDCSSTSPDYGMTVSMDGREVSVSCMAFHRDYGDILDPMPASDAPYKWSEGGVERAVKINEVKYGAAWGYFYMTERSYDEKVDGRWTAVRFEDGMRMPIEDAVEVFA